MRLVLPGVLVVFGSGPFASGGQQYSESGKVISTGTENEWSSDLCDFFVPCKKTVAKIEAAGEYIYVRGPHHPEFFSENQVVRFDYWRSKGRVMRVSDGRKTYLFPVLRHEPKDLAGKPTGTGTGMQTVSQTSQFVAEKVKVNIISAPDGADISINDVFVGSTPSVIQVESGDQTISISKRGYRLWSRKMKVSDGQINIKADLDRE
jgi:hypothetical protein